MMSNWCAEMGVAMSVLLCVGIGYLICKGLIRGASPIRRLLWGGGIYLSYRAGMNIGLPLVGVVLIVAVTILLFRPTIKQTILLSLLALLLVFGAGIFGGYAGETLSDIALGYSRVRSINAKAEKRTQTSRIDRYSAYQDYLKEKETFSEPRIYDLMKQLSGVATKLDFPTRVELVQLLEEKHRFQEASEMCAVFHEQGEKLSMLPYCVDAFVGMEQYDKALSLLKPRHNPGVNEIHGLLQVIFVARIAEYKAGELREKQRFKDIREEAANVCSKKLAAQKNNGKEGSLNELNMRYAILTEQYAEAIALIEKEIKAASRVRNKHQQDITVFLYQYAVAPLYAELGNLDQSKFHYEAAQKLLPSLLLRDTPALDYQIEKAIQKLTPIDKAENTDRLGWAAWESWGRIIEWDDCEDPNIKSLQYCVGIGTGRKVAQER